MRWIHVGQNGRRGCSYKSVAKLRKVFQNAFNPGRKPHFSWRPQKAKDKRMLKERKTDSNQKTFLLVFCWLLSKKNKRHRGVKHLMWLNCPANRTKPKQNRLGFAEFSGWIWTLFLRSHIETWTQLHLFFLFIWWEQKKAKIEKKVDQPAENNRTLALGRWAAKKKNDWQQKAVCWKSGVAEGSFRRRLLFFSISTFICIVCNRRKCWNLLSRRAAIERFHNSPSLKTIEHSYGTPAQSFSRTKK